MIPKDKLERLVIEQIKTRVLTDENLEELVSMVNEELDSVSDGLKERLERKILDLSQGGNGGES
jgi:predicted CopG family antitoxin